MRSLRFPRQSGSGDEPRWQARFRRWVLRALACLVGLLAVTVVAVALFGRSLDQPWVKRRLQGLARTLAGVEIDYRSARLDLLSGIDIVGLAVHSPAEFRPFAPELLQIERADARWSPSSIVGRGPLIRRVTASRITLTAVVDECGRTSFDALTGSSKKSAPEPTLPLSHRASSFLGVAPPVERLDVDHIALVVIRTSHGKVSERLDLQNLSVALVATSAAPRESGVRVVARLGSPNNPLELGLTRTREGAPSGAARAKLWLTVDATSSVLTAAIDVRMLGQTFASSVSADHWLHSEVTMRFDPNAGRTSVTLDHTEAADGAATADGAMEISDGGQPTVRRAHGDIDLARLLAWLPGGLVPVTAARARVRYRIDSLIAGPVVRLSAGGAATVDVDAANVTWSGPAGTLRIGGVEVRLRARPSESGGVGVIGSMKLAGTELASEKERLVADDVAVDVDGQQGSDRTIAGRVGIRFARVARDGIQSVVARAGQLDLRAEGLQADMNDPLTARGGVTLSTELGSLDVRSVGARAMFDGLALRSHTALGGHAPYSVELEGHMSRVRVIGRDGKLLGDAPVRLEGRAHEIRPDFLRPSASRGVLSVAVVVGDTQASLDATKGSDAVDFALRAGARSLKAVRPLLSPALNDEVPWDRMALVVRSSGRIERIASGRPTIRETTQVDIEHPAFENVAARSVSLTLQSQGTAVRQRLDVDLRTQGLAIDGGSQKDDRLALKATVDGDAPSVAFQLATDGHAATNLSGSLSFDPARRAVAYVLEGHLADLAEFAPLAAKVHEFDGFDLSELEIELSARGALLGVVSGVSRDGTVKLEPNLARSAAVDGKAQLKVTHFRWAKGDTAIVTPALSWQGDMRTDGPRRTVESRLDVGTLHLDLGSRDVDVNGVHDEASAVVTGNLADPELELRQRLSIRAVEQALFPEYPLGDVAVALSVEHNPEDGPEGLLHISDMKIVNGVGGTTLAVAGNVDLGSVRRTLSVTTSLTQDLARLSTVPGRFKGRGSVAVEANVTSPDLKRYRVLAALKGKDVTVALPRAGIYVETANGDVPITVGLQVGNNGVTLQGLEARSPYSMLRFSDQHPLLNRSGFLSIAHLRTPFVSIAPLVGNLAIEQNVIALRQFEMGVHNGIVTGQCGIDWNGPKSTVDLHVRAAGVQSSHGEPFDGNIAVAISAADRTIDGRAEILRIGKHHLLDLLDLEDPLHVDHAMNRIRAALIFGYPESLRLVFDHGFASAHLELGGLASLVSIGELRGIPMGPIVDKVISSMLARLDSKEAP